jgi:hypothetical protein
VVDPLLGIHLSMMRTRCLPTDLFCLLVSSAKLNTVQHLSVIVVDGAVFVIADGRVRG